MTPKELHYVLAIQEHQNLSKTAQFLYLSQPALSKYIKNLEASLDVKLSSNTHSPLRGGPATLSPGRPARRRACGPTPGGEISRARPAAGRGQLFHPAQAGAAHPPDQRPAAHRGGGLHAAHGIDRPPERQSLHRHLPHASLPCKARPQERPGDESAAHSHLDRLLHRAVPVYLEHGVQTGGREPTALQCLLKHPAEIALPFPDDKRKLSELREENFLSSRCLSARS